MRRFVGKLGRDWMVYAVVVIVGLILYTFLPDSAQDNVLAIFRVVGGFIFKVAVRGGILYAFARYDFVGVDFKEEVRKGNLAAAVVFLALAVVATSL